MNTELLHHYFHRCYLNQDQQSSVASWRCDQSLSGLAMSLMRTTQSCGFSMGGLSFTFYENNYSLDQAIADCN